MMRQMTLDMHLPHAPTLANYCVGANAGAVCHLLQTFDPGQPLPLPWQARAYLWGESGCGKTHLLLGARAALDARGQRSGWLDGSALEHMDFDEAWTCVFMDDVHAYDAVQQNNAFNWFVNAQALAIAVIAAGAVPPADLVLREDVRTRLAWGHVFGLKALEEPLRRDVLRTSAQARGLKLSAEVLDFMLNHFGRDLGSLMELLNLMDDYALQTRRAITIPLIKSMLETHEADLV